MRNNAFIRKLRIKCGTRTGTLWYHGTVWYQSSSEKAEDQNLSIPFLLSLSYNFKSKKLLLKYKQRVCISFGVIKTKGGGDRLSSGDLLAPLLCYYEYILAAVKSLTRPAGQYRAKANFALRALAL